MITTDLDPKVCVRGGGEGAAGHVRFWGTENFSQDERGSC